jgi:hypothetical protein
MKRNEFKKMLNSNLLLPENFVSNDQSTVSMPFEFELDSIGAQLNKKASLNGPFLHSKLTFVDLNNNKKNNNEPYVNLPTQFLIECVFLIFLDFGGLTRFSFSILFKFTNILNSI